MKNLIIFSIVVLIYSISCSPTTHIKTTLNPHYAGTLFKKIVIQGRGPGMASALDLEWTFKQVLSNSSLEVVTASDVLPRETISPEHTQMRLKEVGADGILVITLLGTKKETFYHPPTSTERRVTRNRNGTVTVQTVSSGDYTERKMTQDFEITLVNAQERPVWVASASTFGDFSYLDKKDFAASLAKKTQKKLVEDGLIQLPPPTPKEQKN